MASRSNLPLADDAVLVGDLEVRPDRSRAEALQRLQVGLAGLGAMVLLIGLASVIMQRADLTEAGTGPDATVPVSAGQPGTKKNDPLAEAGVVPDLPAQAEPAPAQEPAIVPEQGNAPPDR